MFAERRRRLMELMEPGSVLLLVGSDTVYRNRDVDYRYRQDSDFYYLTGLEEPNCALILAPGNAKGEFLLFVKPRDPLKEQWVGPSTGLEGASCDFGADAGCSIDELPTILAEHLQNVDTFYVRLGDHSARDAQVFDVMRQVRAMARQNISAPTCFADPTALLHEMRLRKSSDEIESLRRACKLTADGHRAAMEFVRPGMMEFEVEAFLSSYFRSNGAQRNSFQSITAGGANAAILHYVANSAPLATGDLLLIDAGAEVDYYAGDISRTFPVGARFSEPQRVIYELVLAAEKAGIEAVAPGVRFDQVHKASLNVLIDGLLALGLLEGTRDEVLEDESYKKFYMHKTSHWLGMDVHDVGVYGSGDDWRELEPGMVLTVEPGLYFASDLEGVDGSYLGIGVRIEDDVLVTVNGYEVLTDGVPKEIDEIEALLAL